MFLDLVFKSFQAFAQIFSQTELTYLIGFGFVILFISFVFQLFFIGED